jgi:hypothetical protein
MIRRLEIHFYRPFKKGGAGVGNIERVSFLVCIIISIYQGIIRYAKHVHVKEGFMRRV